MLKNYDPNITFGIHKIEITLQQWNYKGVLQIEISGNCKGASLINDSIIDTIFDCYYEDTLEDCGCNFSISDDDEWFNVVLKDEHGEELEIEDKLDEFERIIVGINIIDFSKDKME